MRIEEKTFQVNKESFHTSYRGAYYGRGRDNNNPGRGGNFGEQRSYRISIIKYWSCDKPGHREADYLEKKKDEEQQNGGKHASVVEKEKEPE